MSATYAPATAGERQIVGERRTSLSRGPALIVGTILLAAGLYFLYRSHTYPRFSNFPNGHAPVDYKAFGIFGINGWTGMLTAVAGGLLLFGAAEHYLSKTMSLIVGAALGAAAIIALISGDVLGLAAANGWTELGWGIAAAILLLNALLPARRRAVEAPASAAGTRPATATTAEERPATYERTHRITGGRQTAEPAADGETAGVGATRQAPVAEQETARDRPVE